MLNKRAYLITPILFIVFFLIAIIFTIYASEIDADVAQGIRVSASIEKGITDIYKSQAEQINFATLSSYECSEKYCYSSGNETQIKLCINQSMNDQYGNITWNIKLTNVSLEFNSSSYNITNINMYSDRMYIKTELNDDLFKKC